MIDAFDRPSPSAPGDTAAEGDSGAAARANHRHAREAVDSNLGGTPTTSAVGDAAATGTATTGARSDHRHGREGFGSPVASAVGDAAADGTAATVPHSDHKHAREAFATTADIADIAATESAGTAATVPRGDHVHALAGMGAWTTWNPTVTQSGNVTFTTNRATYRQQGKVVEIMCDLVITGTGTGANSVIIGGLPVNAAYSGVQVIGSAALFDSSASDDFTAVLAFAGTNNTLRLMSTRASGNLGVASFTAALAVNDLIRLHGSYETA